MKLYILGVVTMFASLISLIYVGYSWHNTQDTEALAMDIDYARNPLITTSVVRERLRVIDEKMVDMGLSKSHPGKYQELQRLKTRAFRLSIDDVPGDSTRSLKYDIEAWGSDEFYGGYMPFLVVLFNGCLAAALLIWWTLADPPHVGWRRRYRSSRTYPRRNSFLPFR